MCGDQAASSATPPSLLDLRGRKKWAAWGDISDELSQTTEGHKKASVAKEMYVELVSTLAGNTVTVTRDIDDVELGNVGGDSSFGAGPRKVTTALNSAARKTNVVIAAATEATTNATVTASTTSKACCRSAMQHFPQFTDHYHPHHPLHYGAKPSVLCGDWELGEFRRMPGGEMRPVVGGRRGELREKFVKKVERAEMTAKDEDGGDGRRPAEKTGREGEEIEFLKLTIVRFKTYDSEMQASSLPTTTSSPSPKSVAISPPSAQKPLLLDNKTTNENSYTSHLSASEKSSTATMPTIPTAISSQAAAIPSPSSTGERSVKFFHHVKCYPSGRLLCPHAIDFSPLSSCHTSSCYVFAGSELGRALRGCYFVEEDIWEAFLHKNKSSGRKRVLQRMESSVSGRTLSEDEKKRPPQTSRYTNKALTDDRDIDYEEDINGDGAVADGVSSSSNNKNGGRELRGKIRIHLSMRSESRYFNVICRIVECCDLPPMDLNGLADPFVYAYVVDDEGKKIPRAGSYRTMGRQRTLYPYFNEVFEIGKDVEMRVDDHTLVLEVWDKDTWSADDLVGVVKVPLWSIPQKFEGRNKPVDVWIPLAKGDKSWMNNEMSTLFSTLVDKQTVDEFHWLVQRRLISKIDNQLVNLGKKFRKNVTNDYYIPSGVALTVGTLVESLWYEVHLQILNILKGVMKIEEIDKYEDCSVANKNFVCCAPVVNRFTAKFRYHLEPFDKTIWGKLRDPWFILFFCLNLVPYIGMQTLIFAFKLIVIEKRDDFQCINYIESFKGLQFVQGLLFLVIGVLKYLNCAGLQTPDTLHTCDLYGPGIVSPDSYAIQYFGQEWLFKMTLFEFLAKVALTYLGFYLLSKSVSLGGKIFVDSRLVGSGKFRNKGRKRASERASGLLIDIFFTWVFLFFYLFRTTDTHLRHLNSLRLLF